MKKALVIGANSPLAKELISQLTAKDWQVQGVYHYNTDIIEKEIPIISFSDIHQLEDEYKAVFYIASVIDYSFSLEALQKIISTNIEFLRLVSSQFSTSVLIHSSTVSIFKPTIEVIKEDSEIKPNNYYSISKLMAEQIVNQHSGGGINIRLSSLFGEYMNEKTFISTLIKQALESQKITLFGDGSRKQNYLSFSEAASYLIHAAALQLNHEFTLLGTHFKSYSNQDVAQIISEYTGTKIHYESEDNSPSFLYDNSWSRNLLKYNSNIDFKTELINYIQWKQRQY